MGLIKCSECGQQVSTKARACPSCGAPPRRGRGKRALLILTALFVGILTIVLVSQNGQGTTQRSTKPTSQATTSPPTLGSSSATPSLDQLETAIRHSDDYTLYRDAFLKAAATLAERNPSSLRYVREHGGWVRSTTHKTRPVYFTYTGGPHVGNRIYLDAATGRLFK
jgi:hypothetical protein